jgi:hypothetical protein
MNKMCGYRKNKSSSKESLKKKEIKFCFHKTRWNIWQTEQLYVSQNNLLY